MKSSIYAVLIACLCGLMNSAIAAPVIERIGAPLVHPWGMDFLDDSTVLVTERGGKLYKINLADGTRQPITGLPDIEARRQGGLLDIAISKLDNGPATVFFCYSKPVTGGSVTAIDRAHLADTSLIDRRTIFMANKVSENAIHYGCRLVLNDDYLHASLGERGARYDAQDPAIHAGAIIRLHHDGSIPKDNPRLDGWAPEIFSKGHRNPQGLAIHPDTGALWSHEHGPRGGDEINLITAGDNYGWPTVSHGKEYIGGTIGIGTSAPGFADPAWVWTPSIAPSGMAFYKGTMFPRLNGHLLVGSLKFKRLYLLRLSSSVPHDELVILDGSVGRVRDVAVAQDGAIFLLSDEADGGLYRLAKDGQ